LKRKKGKRKVVTKKWRGGGGKGDKVVEGKEEKVKRLGKE
jgi:hypothetical protein